MIGLNDHGKCLKLELEIVQLFGILMKNAIKAFICRCQTASFDFLTEKVDILVFIIYTFYKRTPCLNIRLYTINDGEIGNQYFYASFFLCHIMFKLRAFN